MVNQNSESLALKTEPTKLKQIELCADGKYRWAYEYDMLRNPSILFVVLKIFAYLILGMGLLILILGLFDGSDFVETLLFSGKMMLVLGGIFWFSGASFCFLPLCPICFLHSSLTGNIWCFSRWTRMASCIVRCRNR